MNANIPTDKYTLIIGAMKCGTTSLYSYLQGHPQICPAKVKEPEFFSKSPSNAANNINHYQDLWDFNPIKHKYVIEASTGYTKYPMKKNVPKNIYNYGIQPKFIYIIRNPFDRIISHFNFMQKSDSWSLGICDSHLINTSNYYLQLEQFKPYFPVENFLVLDFDTLKDNPKSILSDVYNFLGLSHDYYPETYSVANETKLMSKVERKLKTSKSNALINILPGPIKTIGKAVLRRVAPPPTKRKLSDKETKLIYDALKDDMKKLNQTYKFDTKKWGF